MHILSSGMHLSIIFVNRDTDPNPIEISHYVRSRPPNF